MELLKQADVIRDKLEQDKDREIVEVKQEALDLEIDEPIYEVESSEEDEQPTADEAEPTTTSNHIQ